MLWPPRLCRAPWLLAFCLLMQVHLPAAAAPLSLRGEEEAPPGRAFPKGASAPGSEIQVRPLQEAEPSTAVQKEDSGDADLFQDLDPKTLAAILLQALQPAPKKSASEPLSPEPSPSEERVRSESRSSEERPAEEQEGWRAGKDQRPPQEEQENRGPEESDLGQQELETLQSMLNELQRYSPATKREAPAQAYQKNNRSLHGSLAHTLSPPLLPSQARVPSRSPPPLAQEKEPRAQAISAKKGPQQASHVRPICPPQAALGWFPWAVWSSHGKRV
uniref:VGF nerve growth factor inducible n=1 Tax=Varanus komodoensis TaxID=61221 RepID=A0A8D2IPY3_VARKO